MAKSNADIQRNKRAKEKALLDRIGAEKRSLIVSKALAEALQVLGERHDFSTDRAKQLNNHLKNNIG
ncbi:hypothetical protein [Pseudomonas sp. 18173]|uniref:hypothetical protein n=1 Tax=Pseudomonas sp. 18173 TaxID=3390055 RepID=UPI003D25001E